MILFLKLMKKKNNYIIKTSLLPLYVEIVHAVIVIIQRWLQILLRMVVVIVFIRNHDSFFTLCLPSLEERFSKFSSKSLRERKWHCISDLAMHLLYVC